MSEECVCGMCPRNVSAKYVCEMCLQNVSGECVILWFVHFKECVILRFVHSAIYVYRGSKVLRVLRDLIVHHSSINNSASLCNKFGGFYFIFKFGISGLLHHVVTTIADRIRELLEYMDVHDNDASESSQPSWGKIVYIDVTRTSKDNEDPSWSKSFKTRRTQKTSS
nr:hypothetical protein [Tanacetum cinerariifolium]